MLWLDHLLFGNGRGMKSPHFDNRFYWLSGRLYTWLGGHGAQLTSHQWTHPKPGETRRLGGLYYRPFNSRRTWLRVEVSWATHLPDNLDRANAMLRDIEHALGRL